MAISVDFYLLADDDWSTGLYKVARITEKAYLKQHQVYILTNTPDQTKTLNDVLWTFRDISFLPHNIYEDKPESPSQIQIGQTEDVPDQNDILINLTKKVPNCFQQFNRVLEIVLNTSSDKAAGRKRYKSYQNAACDLQTHEV